MREIIENLGHVIIVIASWSCSRERKKERKKENN